jgi:ribA/ribD-fused uncharacterized protein
MTETIRFNWPSVEHYFQAMKFTDKSHVEKIRRASSAAAAKKLGGSREVKIRRDWEDVKMEIMEKALLAKFTQHPKLREKLLGTKSARLIEDSPYDSFWGIGRTRKGQNKLGLLLMKVRQSLAATSET